MDLSNPEWVYILGAHMGDGCDSTRLDIAAGGHEQAWADALKATFTKVGLKAHINAYEKALRVRASSVPVMKALARWKHGGRTGKWSFPEPITHIKLLLAALVDSDGTVHRISGAMIIFQRNNGNLERLEQYVIATGETRVHLGKDKPRCILLNGHYYITVGVRLGIRGGLRDEVAELLRNPDRKLEWTSYRLLRKKAGKEYRRKVD